MLKDTKIGNNVDTESQLAERFEVYPDLSAGDRVPRVADWLMPGQQGAAPTSTATPLVEVEQVHAEVCGSFGQLCGRIHLVMCMLIVSTVAPYVRRHSLTCFLG